MNVPMPVFAEQYAAAFQEYLGDAGEAALQRAYELGHTAMAHGLRMLDLATVHHETLGRFLRRARTPEEGALLMTAAATFLMESLSPFEMTHRGFLEANTTLRRLNQALEQRVQEVQLARAAAEAAEERARFLAETSMRLDAALDYQARLGTVAQLAVPNLADYCLLDEVAENGVVRRVAATCADPSQHAFAQALLQCGPPAPVARKRASPELRTGRSELWPAVPEALLETLIPDPEDRTRLQHRNLRSAMIVPLQARGRAVARMTLLAAESARCYRPEDLALAEDFAHRAAVALDNARLYQEIQQETQRKDEFLAMLAHELRNPLAPVLTAMHVIGLRGSGDPALERAREVVQRQVRHMARLLDDLLDVSRIIHGKIELRPERVDVATVVHNAVQTSRPFIEAGQHEVSICLPATPLSVEADPMRLEQVFTNLLNNAAKYTAPGGRIWVTAGREGEEAVVRVRDTGTGIVPELLPRIFDLFTQGQRSLDRSQGGLGIGLTLVRRLVELHDGRVEAASAGSGQGSEFTVRLPAHSEGGPKRPAPAERTVLCAGRRCRVLVVEDNRDCAQTLAELLELWGHEVRVVQDGPGALAAAREVCPEVVLLDIGLPGMDGYEVARQLREAVGLERTRLVALTGYGQEEDRDCARDAGFDAHLTKPADLEELQRQLRAVCRGDLT